MNDAELNVSPAPGDPSRRRFLASASATTAGAAVAPLLMGAATQAAPNVGRPVTRRFLGG